MDQNELISNPTDTPRRIDVDLMSILRRYVNDRVLKNFHVISTYLVNVTSLMGKSMSFPCAFFDVISMVEKSTLFSQTFFGVIPLVEKSTLFPLTFFNVILMVEKSTLFKRNFSTKFRWAKI